MWDLNRYTFKVRIMRKLKNLPLLKTYPQWNAKKGCDKTWKKGVVSL